jgi:hypothetical protein
MLKESQIGRYEMVHFYKSCGFDMAGNKTTITDMLGM